MQAIARERRLRTLLTSAGVSRSEIDAARTTARWRPLLACASTAEHAGVDLAETMAYDLGTHHPDRSEALTDALAQRVAAADAAERRRGWQHDSGWSHSPQLGGPSLR